MILLEFSDFECSFCRKFETITLNEIKKRYIDTGLVLFVFRNYPIMFHPFARDAAKAAICAGKAGKYWEMHELLFSTGEVSPPAIKKHAQSLGLDEEAFSACMEAEETDAEIERDMKDAREYGIKGTPFFIIGQNTGGDRFEGEKVVGAQPFEAFQSVIEKYLRLERIHFSTNDSSLSDSAKEILKKHAKWMKGHPTFRLIIEGHTDERGTAEVNKRLGERRAESAMNFLLELGVENSRIKIVSKGEEEPVDPAHEESAWSKNRRVEFIIRK